MIGAALAMMLAQAGGAQAGAPVLISGRCEYPAALGSAERSEVRYECDSVVLSAGKSDDDVLVQFARKTGSEGPLGFAGEVAGDTLTVRRLYIRPGEVVAATGGHCRIFYSGDNISGISCVGRASARTFVANFRASGQ